MDYKFKVNDRVRRTPFKVTVAKSNPGVYDNAEHDIETTTYSTRGCMGTVRNLREETTLAAQESKTKSIMFLVQWDNGTLSYHGPDALEGAA
ncbi:MAG: hypothetical protein ACK5GN_07485 [Pseudomonadota bacterium]|jgi:hypothetical protein